MYDEDQDREEGEPLPPYDYPRRTCSASSRDRGVGHVRRLSNWTLAAMLVGVGASSAALARVVPAHGGQPVAVVSHAPSALGTGSGTAPSGSAPSAGGPVAVSGPSGVSSVTANTRSTASVIRSGVATSAAS